jgi:Kef-type K+ transport system membrane component KefB
MLTGQLSVMFFLQMAVIVATSRALGWLVKRFFGQPHVVGEIIGGVLLGPSLFGALAPEAQGWLFPDQSRDVLFVIAQLGVGVYMFVVGLTFNVGHFRANARSAAAVSLSGMAAPFALALLITPWLLQTPGLFSQGIHAPQATLFMGACIAITAFPVLARIIEERRLANTPLGALTLAAGAIDDVGAWVTLAIVLATVGGGAAVAVKAIGGAVAIVFFMLMIAPKLLLPLARMVEKQGKVSHVVLGVVFTTFMLSAYAADSVGLHAVFGGFILGAAMPRGLLASELRRLLEPFATVVLVPVFFCYSGLNTQLSVVGQPHLLVIAVAILAVSVLAKFGACWAAARLTGQENSTALGIGALMNARGLMELIIINIGLQRGIVETPLFSMMVMMTIVTTLMATPVFELVYGKRARARGELGALVETEGPTAGTKSMTAGR